jgi:septum formation topological specificity factor MinE
LCTVIAVNKPVKDNFTIEKLKKEHKTAITVIICKYAVIKNNYHRIDLQTKNVYICTMNILIEKYKGIHPE